jgi:hypothetical protein
MYGDTGGKPFTMLQEKNTSLGMYHNIKEYKFAHWSADVII